MLTAAPKIAKNIVSTVNATVGKPFKIHIPYTGTPPDKIELTKVCMFSRWPDSLNF